jgi:hypothetical protein
VITAGESPANVDKLLLKDRCQQIPQNDQQAVQDLAFAGERILWERRGSS